MNVYKCLPIFKGNKFSLRGVLKSDAEKLLKVYSDEKAVPLFNGDNCHGDDFHYTTLERMNEAINFWQFSYEHGYFVRWAIVNNENGSAIGTIELFHRDSEADNYGNCGLLRLDIGSGYEKAELIYEILSLITQPAFDLFYCDKIASKVKDFAIERIKAFTLYGFSKTGDVLKGNNGENFYDYYVLKKTV